MCWLEISEIGMASCSVPFTKNREKLTLLRRGVIDLALHPGRFLGFRRHHHHKAGHFFNRALDCLLPRRCAGGQHLIRPDDQPARHQTGTQFLHHFQIIMVVAQEDIVMQRNGLRRDFDSRGRREKTRASFRQGQRV